jgi:hypothetical protein
MAIKTRVRLDSTTNKLVVEQETANNSGVYEQSTNKVFDPEYWRQATLYASKRYDILNGPAGSDVVAQLFMLNQIVDN